MAFRPIRKKVRSPFALVDRLRDTILAERARAQAQAQAHADMMRQFDEARRNLAPATVQDRFQQRLRIRSAAQQRQVQQRSQALRAPALRFEEQRREALRAERASRRRPWEQSAMGDQSGRFHAAASRQRWEDDRVLRTMDTFAGTGSLRSLTWYGYGGPQGQIDQDFVDRLNQRTRSARALLGRMATGGDLAEDVDRLLGPSAREEIDRLLEEGNRPDILQEYAESVFHRLSELQAGERQAAERRANLGLGGQIVDAGAGVLGGLGRAMDWVWQETIAQPYYAGRLAERRGEAGRFLPGAGFFASYVPFWTHPDEEAVNTHEKRVELGLESFGQHLAGDWGPDWHILRDENSEGIHISAASLLDTAFNIIDPTVLVSGGAIRAGNISMRAGAAGIRRSAPLTRLRPARRLQALIHPTRTLRSLQGSDAVRLAASEGRSAFLGTLRGQALREMADVVVRNYDNGDDLYRALNVGRSRATQGVVERVIKAGEVGGTEAARDALMQAFIDGTYRPYMTLRRQLAAGIAPRSAATANIPILLGQRVVRPNQRIRNLLDRWARGEGSTTGGVRTKNGVQVSAAAVDAAVRASDYNLPMDWWDEVVRPQIADGEELLSPQSRYFRLLEEVDEWVVRGAVDDVDIEAGVKAFMDDLISNEGQRLDGLFRLGDVGAAEHHLRRLEILTSAVLGEGGELARQRAVTALRSSYTRRANDITEAMKEASSRLGKLSPEERIAELRRQAKEAPTGSAAPRRPAGMRKPRQRIPSAEAVRRRLERKLDRRIDVLTRQVRKLQEEFRNAVTANPMNANFHKQAELRAALEQLADASARKRNIHLEVADVLWEAFDRNVGLREVAFDISQQDWSRYMDEVLRNRIEELAEQALDNWGKLDLSRTVPVTDENLIALNARIGQLPPDLRAAFKGELADALQNQVADLAPIIGQVELLMADANLLRETDRIVGNSMSRRVSELAEGPQAIRGRVIGSRAMAPVRGAANLALSIMESRPPSRIRFKPTANDEMNTRLRVQDMNRYAQALGFDAQTRRFLTRVMASESLTELGIKETLEEMYFTFGLRAGLGPDGAKALVDAVRKKWSGSQMAFGVADATTRKGILGRVRVANAELLQDVQTVAQKAEGITVLDPDEVRRFVREWKVQGPRDALRHPGIALRRGATAIGDIQLFNLKMGDEELTLRYLGRKGHRFWKLAVVTNLWMAPAGAVAGFLEGDDLRDSLRQGATWGAVGLLGSTRYILRVAGIEEGLFRKTFVDGFTPVEWVPVLNKHWNQFGVDLPYRPINEVGAWDHPLDHVERSFLKAFGSDWVPLAVGDTRYIDGWWRILNYQIHPESDRLTRILLTGKAGMEGLDEATARVQARKFLDTDEGQVLLKRLRDSVNGPRDADEAIERYARFIDYHVPTPDMARARLAAADAGHQVDRATLRQAKKDGIGPRVIHAQETWRMPKNPRQLIGWATQVPSRAVMETATAKMNRIPLAQRVYAQDYRRLVAQGISPEEARIIAEQSATDITNRIMFRQDDQSRFAKKADFLFPFQQPREEMIRVYLALFSGNKAKTMRLGRLAATALNNGEENGLFVKDPYTGSYRMRIPGSAWLSRVMGFGGVSFEVDLLDLTFLFRGMQGSPQSWGADDLLDIGFGVLPTPGGPYWSAVSRLAFNARPELLNTLYDTWLYERLFPYGATGAIFTPFSRRIWMGITGSPPPWEFASRHEMRDEIERWQKEIYFALLWEHRQEHPDDTDWLPDIEDVVSETQNLFRMWALLSAATPASVRPQADYQAMVQEYVAEHTDEENQVAIGELLRARPELAPFFEKRTEWVGPDDYEWWSRQDETGWQNYANHFRRQLSLEQFDANIREARRETEMWNAYREALASPYAWERRDALQQFQEKYPEFDANSRYHQVRELSDILTLSPFWRRPSELAAFRRDHNLSPREYRSLMQEATKFERDPWKEARDADDIHRDVTNAVNRRGVNVEEYVSNLAPAEQYLYWTAELDRMMWFPTLTEVSGSASEFMDRYNAVRRMQSQVFADHPELASRAPGELDLRSHAEPIRIQRWRIAERKSLEELYAEIAERETQIAQLSEATSRAYNERRWTEYWPLKARRDEVRAERQALYDRIREIRNESYKGDNAMKDFDFWKRELSAVVRLTEIAGLGKLWDRLDVPNIPSNEVQAYLNMTPSAQNAYIKDLAESLDIPPDEYRTGKRFWEWLTAFQQDLLRANFSQDIIEKWMAQRPGESNGSPSGGGGYRGSGYGRPNFVAPNGGLALQAAFDLMREYNRRTGPEPAAYKAYLELPQNPAVRADFLRKHPEVRDWISQGPLANMPEIYRYMVIDTMVRHGRWEGEPRDITAITELAWAREQMNRWNLRGNAVRPEAYDIWLAMPSGQARAEYMRQHPEIRDWLQLGPMRNMPEAYREVVRDIMLRYGEWTEASDPLGKLLQQFYRTPGYARDKFLEQHPELVAYFEAMRTPEEQRMHDLLESYYALPNSNARRMFLAAYPELQEYFVQARTKRYERFLNQVAIFMGANPELFTQYLERQEDVLAELLHRFGTPALVRETRRQATPSEEDVARSETGRVRAGQRRGRR